MKKKKTHHVLLTIALLAILSAAGFCIYRYYLDDRKPAFGKDGTIYLHPGVTADQVLEDIVENLAPYDLNSIRRVLLQELEGRSLQEGMYSFSRNHTARFLGRSLTRGWQTPARVVLSGRMRGKNALARKLSRFLMSDTAAFIEAFNDSILLAQAGATPSGFNELIIPDTYEMYWTTTPEEFIARMKKEHDDYWTDERKRAADSVHLTPFQVSVLASIVCEETAKKSDMPLIASVYLNRLAKGMKLQACPTICYMYNYELRRVLFKHLKTESPYNTYLHEGLPPTPICIPSKDGLEAVLHPAHTDYLFFCADSSLNGSSRFASTAAQHAKNAADYSKAMDKLAKKKKNGKNI